MNQLKVVSFNSQLVTDSRDVAEMVGKEHKNLMRDIKGYVEILESSKLSSQNFFIPHTYKTVGNNKTYDCFLLTRKGCDMVANKMTGEKGVLFTATYVTRFEEMEDQQKVNFTLPEDPLELALQTSLKNYQEIKGIKEDVSLLKDSMRIDGRQEFTIKSQGKAKVLESLGGYNSPAYNALSKKVFARMWRDFKNHISQLTQMHRLQKLQLTTSNKLGKKLFQD